MNVKSLKPLSQRELDRIESYCHRLGLRNWDIKEIKLYFIARRNYSMLAPTYDESYVAAYEEFKKAKYRTSKLGLHNIVCEFGNYLTLEPQQFDEYKLKNRNLTDEEIWSIVYHNIDVMIDQETVRAKQIAKENSSQIGCLLIIMSFISVTFLIVLI